MMLKFNEESIRTQVNAFMDSHERLPYIICSEQTYDLFPVCKTEYINYTPFIMTDGTQPSSEKRYHCGCKVFIDNDLKTGEVIFA